MVRELVLQRFLNETGMHLNTFTSSASLKHKVFEIKSFRLAKCRHFHDIMTLFEYFRFYILEKVPQ